MSIVPIDAHTQKNLVDVAIRRQEILAFIHRMERLPLEEEGIKSVLTRLRMIDAQLGPRCSHCHGTGREPAARRD